MFKKVGSFAIPESYEREPKNKAEAARQMIADLAPGHVDIYEFADKKEAQNMRSMIGTMGMILLGNRRVGTKVIENTLHLWLRDAPLEKIQE